MTKEEPARCALVVDDDQPIRGMLRRVLERENCEVELARDGFEAIELLKQRPFDIILLDLMLPRVDGFGVLRFLRNSCPELLDHVVVMTAGPTSGVRERVRGVLSKPFDMEELRDHVRACCHRSDDSHRRFA